MMQLSARLSVPFDVYLNHVIMCLDGNDVKSLLVANRRWLSFFADCPAREARVWSALSWRDFGLTGVEKEAEYMALRRQHFRRIPHVANADIPALSFNSETLSMAWRQQALIREPVRGPVLVGELFLWLDDDADSISVVVCIKKSYQPTRGRYRIGEGYAVFCSIGNPHETFPVSKSYLQRITFDRRSNLTEAALLDIEDGSTMALILVKGESEPKSIPSPRNLSEEVVALLDNGATLDCRVLTLFGTSFVVDYQKCDN